MQLTIGIPAYNEELNIEQALRRLLAQDIRGLPVELKEILVVSDGSTDRSDDIVSRIAQECSVIRLVRLEKRSGYPVVIDRILSLAQSDIVALFDADAFAEPDCLRRLLEPLVTRPEVGGTSGRKIPYNKAMMPEALWEMIHYFNLAAPKMSGSVMAFRNVIKSIPTGYVNSDVYIQIVLARLGLKVVYVPQAIAKTVEPETLKGYFHQRKRVYRGHLQLIREEKVRLPSVGIAVPVKALAAAIKAHPGRAFNLLLCSFLEGAIRLWAVVEHRSHLTPPTLWRRTKQ